MFLGFFGGTYESAKTDERNEFNRMIRFVKNQKVGVSALLVYSLDRFSRTGDNAISISSELRKQGICIFLCMTQPIDLSTHSAMLYQLFNHFQQVYDDLRRENRIAESKKDFYAENEPELLR